jgi:hypothetical protein
MLYMEIVVVCSWTFNLVVHKRNLCLTNVMHFANVTDTLCPYVSKLGERKKEDMQQNVKKCKRVTKRSAAVWRLPPSV